MQFGGVGAVMDRLNISRPGAVPDTDALTSNTAGKMAGIISRASAHPVVVRATRLAMLEGGVKDWTDHAAVRLAVWDWVRRNVRFVEDDDVLRAQLNLPDELELLIEPPLLLSMGQPAGDCDDFTDLTGAMLLSAGIPSVEVVTIKADWGEPARWSHVYLGAQCADGYCVLDCSHGEWLGWEAPQYYARQAWGRVTGTPAALQEHNELLTAKGAQMHGLTMRPGMAAYRTVRGMGALGAMDWGAFAQQVTAGGLDIVKTVVQKPGQYIQTQQGVISYGVPGASPNPNSLVLQTPLGSAVGNAGGVNSGTLIIGAAVVVGLLLFLKK